MITLAGILNGCTAVSRKHFPEPAKKSDPINQMLYYASLAGNSHNTQPWLIKTEGDSIIKIYADTSRKLQIVDPEARGLFISLGAFIENLHLAAGSLGYETEIRIIAKTNRDLQVANICLKPAKPSGFDLKQIENRRTLRIPFMKETITENDLKHLVGNNGAKVHFFSATDTNGQYIARQTLAAYIQQANDLQAKQELANWIRFSNKDVNDHRDGLTTSGMDIGGIGGFIIRNFFKPEDSMKQSFVDAGIKRTRKQIENCGGWILITQAGNSPESWISTGRIYQRMNIDCYQFMIGYHPMNQMIEEQEFEGNANNFLGTSGVIQFVARVGYVKEYPEAVSVRRPVAVFVKQ